MSSRGRKSKHQNSELDQRSLQNTFDVVADVDLKDEFQQMANIGIDLAAGELTYDQRYLLEASDLNGHIRSIMAKNGVRKVDADVFRLLSDAVQQRLLDILEDMRDLSIQRTDAVQYSANARVSTKLDPYLAQIEKRERDAWKNRLEPNAGEEDEEQDMSLLDMPLDKLTAEQKRTREKLEKKQEKDKEIKTANTLAMELIGGSLRRSKSKRKKNATNAGDDQTNDPADDQTGTTTQDSNAMDTESATSQQQQHNTENSSMEMDADEREEAKMDALHDRKITFQDGMEWVRNDPRVGSKLITKWHMIDEGQHLVVEED
eukprot:TRINITY_DN3192_c0_g1_i1.p1 TRINITY_DN3192_c0_g1~~TRINITY_DN3192_c0_g1_i1.p1  ORF type:complete len:327 (+),score=107.62 TRINITY_DN3192_c0_g1_i1:30-983(+)